MSKHVRATRWASRAAVLVAATTVAVVAAAAPADAYTVEMTGYNGCYVNPWVLYDKNAGSPLDSTLTAWVSTAGVCFRLSMRAGSGTGTTFGLGSGIDDCATDTGWLPNGYYGPGNGDATFVHRYKNDGNSVVRGWVWDLGDKACSGPYTNSYPAGKQRTELFIHSQGYSGWSDSNYRSAGCIKINQDDRAALHSYWNNAYNMSSGYLLVVT